MFIKFSIDVVAAPDFHLKKGDIEREISGLLGDLSGDKHKVSFREFTSINKDEYQRLMRAASGGTDARNMPTA